VPVSPVPLVSGPAPSTPARRSWSVRRTSTIDTTWPEGYGTAMHMTGRARDLLTGTDPVGPRILAEDGFAARLTPQRQIITLTTEPVRAPADELSGSRAGSQLRLAIARVFRAELEAGTPLYLLLDDIAGASLVCVWAWSQWHQDWNKVAISGESAMDHRRAMAGVCIGFSPDSPVMTGDESQLVQNNRSVGQLDATEDAWAWHALNDQNGPAARRARRIDVHFEGELIVANAHFQDSCTRPDGGREAVHEYLLRATVDRASMTIRSIVADPRILPFNYCPAAILNIGRLVGSPIGRLRATVIEDFARTEGCTHLNDMMRSLAEVPQLAGELERAGAAA
jgi:hypothetical protein